MGMSAMARNHTVSSLSWQETDGRAPLNGSPRSRGFSAEWGYLRPCRWPGRMFSRIFRRIVEGAGVVALDKDVLG